jgi:CubicO group peptidase (beta-lactamase class C family)
MSFFKPKCLLPFAVIIFFLILPTPGREKSDFPNWVNTSEEETLASLVIKELQSKIPEWLKERDVPGAAIAVVDDSGIIWKYVSGHTDRTRAKPITPRTLFSIQSMSKSFTALGILRAVQDGLLDLDVPITRYLPGFEVNSRYEDHPEQKITLRHLLAHRAGFDHEAPVGGNFDSRPHTFEEHILSISDTWLRYPVGYRFSYSNLGIDLAGYILEKKTGLPFWKYIQEKIFIPLGMKDSTINIDTIRNTDDRAIGHVSPKRIVPGGIPVEIPMIPAGGVYSNIEDIAQYLRFHINKGLMNGNQVLKRELIEEMHTAAFPEKHQRFGYGLCIGSTGISQTSFLSHGGGGYGFITSMTMYPNLKIGIVTLTNKEGSPIQGGRIQGVINAFIEKKMGQAKPKPENPTVDTTTPLALEDERVKKITGFYGGNVRIGFKEKALGIFIGKDFYPLQLIRTKR